MIFADMNWHVCDGTIACPSQEEREHEREGEREREREREK